MVVEFLSFWHVFWLVFYLVVIVGLYQIFKNKPQRTQQFLIYGLILLNFIFHFTFPAFIQESPERFIRAISLSNICAVIVLMSPFIYWQRDHFLKPGWLYVSIIAGVAILVNPTDALGRHPFELDVLRFFIQHLIIFVVPILLISFNHETLRWRYLWTTPIFMMLIVALVIANAAILQVLGVIPDMRSINAAFQWRPAELEGALGWLVPTAFTRVPFGINAGEAAHWPLIYKLPAYFVLGPLATAGINGINMAFQRFRKK